MKNLKITLIVRKPYSIKYWLLKYLRKKEIICGISFSKF